MNYVTAFKNNFLSRKSDKSSCTKSGLVPMKALNVTVDIMRFLKIYNMIYSASLNILNLSHRKRLFKFYSQFIKKGDLCFDIGANLGSRTDIFLKLGARVVSVEPQRKCMRQLRKKYGSNQKVSLVRKAVGENVGIEDMLISNSHTVSTMSKDWIESLKSSDMFFVSTSAFQWQKSVKVQVTTFDELVEKYGIPDFCKIDVEGYEYEVLKGLNHPVKLISFEFTPTKDFISRAIDTVKHLASIGKVEFNYSLAETMTLSLEKWADEEEIEKIILNLLSKTSFAGDIYARFV